MEKNVRSGSAHDSGRAAIYIKRDPSPRNSPRMDKAAPLPEIEVEKVPSEKSYDSESELDLDAELAELERQEELKRLAEESGQQQDEAQA